MVIARAAPAWSKKYQPTLNTLGNILITAGLVLALFKLGPALEEITPMLPIAALLLALGCMSAVWLIRLSDPVVRETFAISNANRHVGLALLLSTRSLHASRALPAIACYAIVVPLVMFAYTRWYRGGTSAQTDPAVDAKKSLAAG
jgi:hypothetical protein